MTVLRRRPTGRRLVVALLAGAALLGAGVRPAGAHAVLKSTSPVDGEQLTEAPAEVRLAFDEPVSVPTGGVRVYDSSGQQVDRGRPGGAAAPNVVGVGLADRLRPGTYIVTWRVVSADGHPVKGAFVFSVGAGGQVADSVLAQVFSAQADRPFAVAATVARWLMYVATLLAAGTAAFLVWVARPPAPDREQLARVGAVAAAVAALAVVAGIPLQAAEVTGAGLAAFVHAGLLAETVAGSVGLTAGVQLTGLATLAVALRRPRAVWFTPTALGGAGVTLGALLLSGHTRTVQPIWLMVAADAAHLAAAAAWFGGLVLLAVALRRRRFADDPVGAAALVARFSLLATVSVMVVTVAGAAMGWALVRALRALTATVFGWTLLTKVGLAAAVMAVGAYNNRRLVPAVAEAQAGPARRPAPVAGASSDAPATTEAPTGERGDRPARAWALLGRTVRWEVAGLVAVLAVTAALVYLQPASEAAGITGAYSTYVDVGQGRELNVVVDPNRVGRNEIHLYLLDRTGRPAAAEELTVRLSMPAKDIGPITRAPQAAGPGHWLHAGSELSIPGRWQLQVSARISEFEELRATVTTTVNP